MCGRMVHIANMRLMVDGLNARLEEGLDRLKKQDITHYNISPEMTVPIVRSLKTKHDKDHVVTAKKWGCDFSGSGKTIANARVETVHVMSSWRAGFRSARCLIPASGFYEWKNRDARNGYNLTQEPCYIKSQNRENFYFAGILGSTLEDYNSFFVVLTRDADTQIEKSIHYRMPLIIASGMEETWLRQSELTIPEWEEIHRYRERLIAHRVSPKVNDPNYNHVDCIKAML